MGKPHRITGMSRLGFFNFPSSSLAKYSPVTQKDMPIQSRGRGGAVKVMAAHTLLLLTADPLSLDNCSLPHGYGALVLQNPWCWLSRGPFTINGL